MRLDTSDPAAVVRLLRGLPGPFVEVLAERITCPPWMPRRVVASLHRSLGLLEGVCAVQGFPLVLITPAKWQAALFGAPAPAHRNNLKRTGGGGGSSRKKSFVLAARERWPDGDFPQSWGTADACWIAEYGRRAKVPA